MSMGCPAIEVLHLVDCYNITDKVILAMGHRLQRLNSLDLQVSPEIFYVCWIEPLHFIFIYIGECENGKISRIKKLNALFKINNKRLFAIVLLSQRTVCLQGGC